MKNRFGCHFTSQFGLGPENLAEFLAVTDNVFGRKTAVELTVKREFFWSILEVAGRHASTIPVVFHVPG